MRKSIQIAILCLGVALLLFPMLLVVVQAAEPTTSVHIIKYAADGTTILNETTVSYEWLENNLPVHGDCETHYYHQGPTFDDTNLWDENEMQNLAGFDAVMGTSIMDLCDVVGGMSPGDEVAIKCTQDGFSKKFGYETVYEPSDRQGPLVLTWWRAEAGYVPDYETGMQLVFFANTKNPDGKSVFGNWDMHECLAEEYRHYFGVYPSSKGLSVKWADLVAVYSAIPSPTPAPSPSSTEEEDDDENDEEPPLSPPPPSPSPVPPTPSILLWGPYITGTTTNTTTINWKTDMAAEGTVKYATDGNYTERGEYYHRITDTEKKELHHLAITNLTSNTIYHYQLTVRNESYGDYTFRTYPGTNSSFSFIVYGDTRAQIPLFTQMERHKLVADRIAKEANVSFVIHTGDFVSDGSNQTLWDEFFDSGRAMMANRTFYPVLGNHEYNHTTYYDAFRVFGWYSFDCGNAHFTVLDSNDWADMTRQTTWLQNDIDRNTTWKFVIFHHPPYSSDERHWGGWTCFRDYWENIFMNNSVDAVFNSHVHAYERYEEKGIQYMVLGCGGAPLYPLAEEKIPGYQNSFEHTLGYAKITIDDDNATIEVVQVADVSEDNREVTQIYPPNTIFERVVLNQTTILAPTATPIPTPPTSPTPTTGSSPSPAPIPTQSATPEASGFGALFAIIGLIVLAYMIKRRK